MADEVLQRPPRLHVLISNVGGYWNTRHITADGFEHAFALDHLAPFLLTNLLLDRLMDSAPARVITVSSHAHTSGRSSPRTGLLIPPRLLQPVEHEVETPLELAPVVVAGREDVIA